jgi:hypothetical protein
VRKKWNLGRSAERQDSPTACPVRVQIAVGFGAVFDSEDNDGIAEIVKADAVVADAETEFGRLRANNEVRALYIRHQREPSPFFEFLAARLLKGFFVNEFLLKEPFGFVVADVAGDDIDGFCLQ